MYSYGARSDSRLDTVCEELQEVFDEAIKLMDISILEGHRSEEAQNTYYDQGKSKVQYPNSMHNSYPSLAVDAVPYPVDWNDTARFAYMAGIVIGIGQAKGYKIRWGGDWNSNGRMDDQTFNDLPHFEYRGKL